MKKVFLVLASIALISHLLYQITAVFSHNQSQLAQPVEIIDLGTLGGETSVAADLNEIGEVVGNSETPNQEGRAFWWRNGPMQPLNASDDLTTEVYTINDSGIVAGVVISGTAETPQLLPALWIDGAYTQLPAGEAGQASARDINDNGIAAGFTTGGSTNHILLWANESITETIPSENGVAQVNGLNIHNQIVGMIQDDGAGNRAFLLQDDVLQDLGTLGGQNSIAYDINDAGMIVGAASIEEDLATHAFLWQDGEMSDLGTVGDVQEATSRALGINSTAGIVGEAQVGAVMHAVMWQNGQIVDLNTLLPEDSEWEALITAANINDKGWITGTGLIGGQKHAFLLRSKSPGFMANLPVVAGEAILGPTPIPTGTPVPTATPPATVTPSPSPTPSTQGYDLVRYMQGDGRLYEVHFKANEFESQARHQTQFSGGRFYHTKGNEDHAEWEELWNDAYYIYRGTDTSPGNGMYYTLYESVSDYLAGNPGSKWGERYMRVGDMYFRRPYVVFFRKSDCSLVAGGQYPDPSWLKFQAYHWSYTFDTGITVYNVVELAWMQGNENGPTQPVDERYFYAAGYGLVGWKKPSLGWRSAISEEHPPGERQDNTREVIACRNNTLNSPQSWSPKLSLGPLTEPYASMVKP